MRIAVCDDERAVRSMLVEKVQEACQQAALHSYSSGRELLAGKELPDIVFLDIQMPGMDGMETARILRQKNREIIIIFVTAIEEYVFQAFDVGAFHYLVKPFTDQKLVSVLNLAVEQYECRAREKMLPDMQQEQRKYIMVKTGGTYTRVIISEIIYAEVMNRKITIHRTDGDIEYYGRMSELEKQAGPDFFRSHRGYLVHFKYVLKYDASTIYLERGTALMSKLKFSDFVKEYLKYNQRMCPAISPGKREENHGRS